MAGLGVDSFGADVGGGAGDDFLKVPGEEVGIGGEHEGDGAAEHGAGVGVSVEHFWDDFSAGELADDLLIKGADLGFLEGAVLVVLGVPGDGSDAGEGGAGEVLLDSGGGKDGFGNVLGDEHGVGLGEVFADVAGAGDEEESAEVSVLHDLAPVGFVFAEAGAAEAHAVGVGSLFDGPLDGALDAALIDDSGPATEGGDAEGGSLLSVAGATDDVGTVSAVEDAAVFGVAGEGSGVELVGFEVEVVAVEVVDVAVAVIVFSISGNLHGVAVDGALEVRGDDEVFVVDDVEGALSGDAEFLPDLVGFEASGIRREVFEVWFGGSLDDGDGGHGWCFSGGSLAGVAEEDVTDAGDFFKFFEAFFFCDAGEAVDDPVPVDFSDEASFL